MHSQNPETAQRGPNVAISPGVLNSAEYNYSLQKIASASSLFGLRQLNPKSA